MSIFEIIMLMDIPLKPAGVQEQGGAMLSTEICRLIKYHTPPSSVNIF
jgi:hypothetical protein